MMSDAHDAEGRTHRTAAVVSCGDELTLGQKLDTNGRWLSARLVDLGIVPVEHVTVPDDLAAQAAALRRLARVADVIISSGGLGPTEDDLTRAALAEASDDTLVEDAEALAQIAAWFAARGREMTALNRVQAKRPSRGACLKNEHGTAPGLSASIGNGGRRCDVFCLPGPPREMMPMFESLVAPRLRPPVGVTVRTRVLHTFGLGESDIAAALGAMMRRDASPLVGTTASAGVVSVRVRYEGELPESAASALLDRTERSVRDAVGPYVFGEGDVTLARAVLRTLGGMGRRLAVVESCTGGMLGQMITDEAGASAVFLGGLVTYSNALKTRLAGVPEAVLDGGPGAVSAACAEAMARGGLDATGASDCLAITGIAGPGGAVAARDGRAAKPVGTVYIARASRAGISPEIDVRRFSMGGDRESVRRWSAMAALAMMEFAARGRSDLRLLRQSADA